MLEKLYKKSNSTGKIQEWEIKVVEKSGGGNIITIHGDVGGKLQETQDLVTSGKNQGRTNETTAFEQAKAEAKAKWEKQLKKGYVKSLELAESGAKDELILGGIEPMLAHSFEKQGDKIIYPCFTQPKLDGMRSVAIKNGESVTLWSRTRKRINSCPHIENAIASLPIENIILDGELYAHELRHDFEKIISAVRKDEPSEESNKIQYHIYDLIQSDMDYEERRDFFVKNNEIGCEILKLVQTLEVKTAEEVPSFYDKFAAQGYEGAMLRNKKGHYAHARSANLIKVKKFEDAEFEIVGGEEGRGKLAGHLGSFVVKNEAGDTFNVKMSGDQELSKEYWENLFTYIGKHCTVQFQGLTKYGIPRFPVGLRIRESMDC